MNLSLKFLLVAVVLFILWWQGCAPVKYQEDAVDYQQDIRRLETELRADPANEEALRELGVLYFKAQQYELSRKLFIKAFQVNPQNPQTLFYLGMNLEFANQEDNALKVYQKYIDVSRLSPYRRLMEGRYHWLTREKIRHELQALVKEEETLSAEALSPTTLAIFPFTYQGGDTQFASLGRGLSEMLIIDLGRINSLQVVERVRMEVLLEEITRSQAEAFDPSTAPRAGKLLRAGQVIKGSYDVFDKDQLRIDISSLNVLSGELSKPISGTDALNNLFKIEKDLVFRTIELLGVELTPEERRKIQFIPTQNVQAYLAYTMGLDDESAGRFNEAAEHYGNAAQMDKSFALAKSRADYAGSLGDAGGSKEEAAVKADALEKSLEKPGDKNLVNRRLQKIARSLGSNFVPGQDSRESAEEAAAAGVELLPDNLQDPPPPPEGSR